MEAVSDQALGRFFTSSFASEQPDVFHHRSRALLGTDPAGYAACCAALRDADLREMVEAIRCPTLVIGGSDDISTPPDQSVWLHEHIPGSTAHILAGAPHLANLEQPQAWTDVVAGFLAGQGAV
jgi:3-oxoadipate enol-lactonase